MIFSDHVPLCLGMEIDVSCHELFERKCNISVAWHKCTEVHIENYKREHMVLKNCLEHYTCSTMACLFMVYPKVSY